MNLEDDNSPLMIMGCLAVIVVIVIWCIGLYRTAELIIGWIK